MSIITRRSLSSLSLAAERKLGKSGDRVPTNDDVVGASESIVCGQNGSTLHVLGHDLRKELALEIPLTVNLERFVLTMIEVHCTAVAVVVCKGDAVDMKYTKSTSMLAYTT